MLYVQTKIGPSCIEGIGLFADEFIMASDDAKYFNHSRVPNCLSAYYDDEEEVVTKAVMDINSGYELTDDYESFEKDFSEVEFV